MSSGKQSQYPQCFYSTDAINRHIRTTPPELRHWKISIYSPKRNPDIRLAPQEGSSAHIKSQERFEDGFYTREDVNVTWEFKSNASNLY